MSRDPSDKIKTSLVMQVAYAISGKCSARLTLSILLLVVQDLEKALTVSGVSMHDEMGLSSITAGPRPRSLLEEGV
jgi:hypothetical protein